MKISYSILLLIFALITSNCFGQDDNLESDFPDTIYYSKLEKITLSNYDSTKITFLDTIKNPNCFLVRMNPKPYEQNLSIAFKKKNSWELYEIIQDVGDNLKIEKVDFNGKGNNELIVYYSNSYGHSSWFGGLGEHQKGFFIIDLDKLQLIANIENYTSHVDWFQEFDPNESDTLEFSERTVINSGGEQYGSNYIVSISEGKIILTESKICDDFDENIVNEFDKPKIVTYNSTKNALIKRKTK